MARKRLKGTEYDGVVNRNAGVCCVCKRRGIGVHVHHIDHDPSNNDLVNLAVLCVQEHDAHHRPGRYPALNHLDLGAEGIRRHKQEWEALVAEARRPRPAVLAVVNAYGSPEYVHAARLLFQRADGRVVLERTYHDLDGPADQWVDAMLEVVKWLGESIPIIVIDEPLPVEHCPCCRSGLRNVLNPGIARRLTAPAWGERSWCSIYVNPSRQSLAIHVAYGDEVVIAASLHKCGAHLHLAAEGLDERVPLLGRPSVRTRATSVVDEFLRAWSPAQVLIGSGDPDRPELIDRLTLPRCWER